MVISSRTPEGNSANCPICEAEITLEPSSTLGDATCPNCGRLIWFIRMDDEIRTFNNIDDRVALLLDDYLVRRGFRMTNQRRLIALLVTAIDSPFSADDLITMSRELPADRWITIATVYRTLIEFVDAQILDYTRDGDDRLYSLC